jgi:putative ABC transport system ATP-binding protein
MDPVIQVKDVTKIYRTGEVEVKALNSLSLEVNRGEFSAVAGPSGSGKTTLLNVLSGLDIPTSGNIMLGGREVDKMSGTELSDFRRDHIGFIFQSYNLIPVLTVRENVEYIMLLQGVPREKRHSRVDDALKDVGLEGFEKRRPLQLSGGQQQRVAVARALVSRPDIILADEPTANLDTATGASLLEMMRELNQKKGITFLFSTHEIMIMEMATRLIKLKDGAVESDEQR